MRPGTVCTVIIVAAAGKSSLPWPCRVRSEGSTVGVNDSASPYPIGVPDRLPPMSGRLSSAPRPGNWRLHLPAAYGLIVGGDSAAVERNCSAFRSWQSFRTQRTDERIGDARKDPDCGLSVSGVSAAASIIYLHGHVSDQPCDSLFAARYSGTVHVVSQNLPSAATAIFPGGEQQPDLGAPQPVSVGRSEPIFTGLTLLSWDPTA